jgi:hypothetical protein
MTALTLMMAVDTAAKWVTLLTIIDLKQQGTNHVCNNPPATNFRLEPSSDKDHFQLAPWPYL